MRQKVWLLFLFVLVSGAIFNYGAIPAAERAAVIALYNSTDGDHWFWNFGWKTPPLAADGFAMPGTENNWFGIIISGNTVTEIDLDNNYVDGTLPPEVGNLSNLESILIRWSGLHGSIPPELGKLSNLKSLALIENQLSGSIPPELGNLYNLEYLYLYDNELSGEIPATLGNLSNLKTLSLEINRLSGPIPAALGNLSNLQYLYLPRNQLSGPIPAALGNLSNLNELYLSNNRLSGPIPSELGNLSNLNELYLDHNQLSDPIPSELGNLSNSNELDLSNNQLSGHIPTQLSNLSQLNRLNLWNNQLNGPIPPELGNLSNLKYFYLSGNQLNGPIPTELGNLSNLYHFYLSYNQLSGEIPFNLTHLTKVYGFSIEYNCLYTNNFFLWQWLSTINPYWEDHQDHCTPSVIVLNRSHLYFGATIGGATTAPQTVIIKNIGAEPLAWTAVGDTPWLNVSPTSGTGPGLISIAINPAGLSAGTFTGAVTVSALNAGNSPQTIPVTLKIYDNGGTAVPFGDFATPVNASTVSGNIPVTGWVLDDIEVKKVEIFDGVNYIGEAAFVEGARPDVEQAYPGYPRNYKAGWGYLLLSNFLTIGYMNNYHILYVKVTDAEGNQVILGSKTIFCDNAHARNPFGYIDTPTQCGIASGKDFVNLGWALTPNPNIIQVDGSTIDVWIDGEKVGNPTYNIYREDIAALFPGYANSNGAGGEFYLDTTRYKNGLHTIFWIAGDSFGNRGLIGTRFFSIENPGNSPAQEAKSAATDMPFVLTVKDLENFPGQPAAPGKMIKGYEKDEESCGFELLPDSDGITRVSIKELERIEIQMGENLAGVADVRGYMIINGDLRPLPIGSTLDIKAGKFYWSPGPGFYGKYNLVFLIKDSDGQWSKKMIEIDIGSKYD